MSTATRLAACAVIPFVCSAVWADDQALIDQARSAAPSMVSDAATVMYQGKVQRYGGKTEVLSPPFDDYTDLLLSSVPEMRLGWLEEVIANRKMESAGN